MVLFSLMRVHFLMVGSLNRSRTTQSNPMTEKRLGFIICKVLGSFAWVQLVDYVTLGKLLNISVPRFSC